MSTQESSTRKESKRHYKSIVAEAIICKSFGWKVGFLSGGVSVLTKEELLRLLRLIHAITGEKIWLNTGILPKQTLEECKPYIEGVVGTVEVINPILHDDICPSKPIAPIERMFGHAKELGIRRAMTLIVGLGETINDVDLLMPFIEKHGISKIHIYGLIPQKGTAFENTQPPSAEYQAEWIARVRIAYPDIEILCGIWKDRPEYISLLLKAGANSISKFPALRKFNSLSAQKIEAEVANSGRTFEGTLTKMHDVDVDSSLAKLDLDDASKQEIKKRCDQYIALMKRD